MTDDTIINVWSSFGSSVAGAFLGAASAFGLGIWQQKKDKRTQQHAALIQAHFTLVSQWNILANIKRTNLDPHRKKPDRHLFVPEQFSIPIAPSVEISKIAFIAILDPNLLRDIALVEQNYLTAIDNLKFRNKCSAEFHASATTVDFNYETGQRKLKSTLENVYPLEQSTNLLYDVVDGVLPKFVNVFQCIDDFSRRHFRGMKRLKFTSKE